MHTCIHTYLHAHIYAPFYFFLVVQLFAFARFTVSVAFLQRTWALSAMKRDKVCKEVVERFDLLGACTWIIILSGFGKFQDRT